MIIAAPLVAPFAKALGLSVGMLGMGKATDLVNKYIQENPEQSKKIISAIMPAQGIASVFEKRGIGDKGNGPTSQENLPTEWLVIYLAPTCTVNPVALWFIVLHI